MLVGQFSLHQNLNSTYLALHKWPNYLNLSLILAIRDDLKDSIYDL